MTPFDGNQWHGDAVTVAGAEVLNICTTSTAAVVIDAVTASDTAKYNAKMVTRLLRAKAGRLNSVPSDEAGFIKWLTRA